MLYPLVQAVHYSLFNWSGLGPLTDFVGLQNYRDAFNDPDFIGAIQHNFILVALSIVIQFPLALGVALMLDRPFRGRRVARLVFFAPYVLSEATTAVIWLLILQPDGLVDRAFKGAGLGWAVQLWLADLNIVLFTLFVVITWKYIGFGIILFLAGLQGIPRGAERRGGDRRCGRAPADPVHHAAAARTDDPHLGLPRRSSARCSCSTSSGS